MVTGEKADENAGSEEVTLKWGDKPVIVYVCDEAAGCDGFDKLENVVLKDEKVAIGMKAFKTVKMHPDHAAADPVTAGKGREVPRMLLIDPTKMKVTVLEKGKLKASGLFAAMKKVSGKVYKENLKKVVDSHIKMLNKQDQLANAMKTIDAKIARISGDSGKSAEKEIEKVKGERDELKKEIAELNTEKKAIWKLTPKKKSA